MIRCYCDICDCLLDSTNTPQAGSNDNRISISRPTLNGKSSLDGWATFEVLTSLGGVGNAGHFCMDCIFKAFEEASKSYQCQKQYAANQTDSPMPTPLMHTRV